MNTDADTRKYYDSFTPVYRAVWGDQIHTGFFDKDKPLEQAVQDMNAYLAKQSGIRPGKALLNAGCGSGEADRWLARELGMRVKGIDLTDTQLDVARERAIDEALDIGYVKASMSAMPFGEGSFDYVWLQESFFFCHDKERAAAEFHRVLKPGGLVVLEDTILADKDSEGEVMKVFGGRLPINGLLTVDGYSRLFQRAGFSIERIEDLSPHLERTYAAISEGIKDSGGRLHEKVPPAFHQRIASGFGFPESQRLVAEGKLGCVYMLLKR